MAQSTTGKIKCVLYSAEWCKPCAAFKKAYWPKLKKEFPDVSFKIVDIDRNLEDDSISSIPTIRIYRGKKFKTFRNVVDDIETIKEALV